MRYVDSLRVVGFGNEPEIEFPHIPDFGPKSWGEGMAHALDGICHAEQEIEKEEENELPNKENVQGPARLGSGRTCAFATAPGYKLVQIIF